MSGNEGYGGAGQTTRRAFLGGAATTGLAVLGTGTVAAGGKGDGGKSAPSDFPRVTTRGHFEENWYGGVDLTDGHTEYDYDLAGDFSGVFGGDELLVFCHGWLNDDQGGLDTCYTGVTNLELLGYSSPGIGYLWDSDTGALDWGDGTEIAERNGPKLANFLADLDSSYPETDVRLVAHSLGARVVLRALEVLNGSEVGVESVSLLGGAADNDAVSTEGRYGADIESVATRCDNFWKSDDGVLNNLYTTAEWDSAVGEEGCEGPAPANYTDVNVDYVPDHYSYYYEDDGCLPAVYSRF